MSREIEADGFITPQREIKKNIDNIPIGNKYRKKPVIIEAVKWDGNNIDSIVKFCGNDVDVDIMPNGNDHEPDIYIITIFTLEGAMRASIGDYIIKGVNGEFYPCKPDIFEKTYERI